MLKKNGFHSFPYDGPAPAETLQLEREGHCVLRGAFGSEEIAALHADILAVYEQWPPDRRPASPPQQAAAFRYEMFNRSALCQRAIANPRVLAVVEPLLGDDCHAINCTAWRNPPGRAADQDSYFWHIDAGPHVPRPANVDWPDAIPYPIFVIGTHVYLEDCTLDDGPTMVVPTSHRSGQLPPTEHRFDPVLEYRGHKPVAQVARAGDVSFFVSDAWHRRSLPTDRSRGRFFLQTNYGRRDVAQRILPTAAVNHVSEAARGRAVTARERTLIGLHPANYYDG